MAQQLAVFIENHAGSLAELTGVLAKAKINILSIMVEGTHDYGVARLQVQPLRGAEKALEAAEYQFTTGDVLVVRLSNEPGALNDVLQRLAKAKVNVEFLFGTTGHDDAEMVLKVDDVEKAKKAVGKA